VVDATEQTIQGRERLTQLNLDFAEKTNKFLLDAFEVL
jgi:hypothetical protein